MHIEIHMITYLIRSCTRSHLQYKQWTNVDHPVTFMNFNCLFAQRADFLHGHMLTDFYRDFGARKARRDASQNTYRKSWSYNYEVTKFRIH